MIVGVIDIETSMKPTMHPWQKGAFLSTIGIWVAQPHYQPVYKEWVYWHWDHYQGWLKDDVEEEQRKILFEIQDIVDKLDLIVGHNIGFDLNWLKAKNIIFTGKELWDTMLVEFMLSGQDKEQLPMKGQSLSHCCERHNLPVKTDVVKTYWDAGVNTDKVPLRILLPYQKNDVEITAQLFKSQYRQAKAQDKLFKLIRVRNYCIHSITDIELNGMPMDRDKAEALVVKFSEELDNLNGELRSYFGRDDINLDSGPELSAGLFGGVLKRVRYVPQVYTKNVTIKEPYELTYKSGKKKGMTVTKTRKDVLKNLKTGRANTAAGRYKKRALEILVHRSKISTLISKFKGSKEGTGIFYHSDNNIDGRPHPGYNQTIAATGRMTSSGDMNGQNASRSKEDEDGFINPQKSVFVPSRPGGLVLVIDLSQLEWRVAAWMSQDKTAMDEIRNGVDCHLDNAIKFFGDASYRQDAKIFTFRLLYGGSAYAFFMDPKMPNFSKGRWNEIVRQYEQKYRGITAWQQANISLVPRQKGLLYSPTGRIYKIPQEPHKRYPNTMVYKDTCIKNYMVQGTATGDIVPLAMNIMDDRMNAEPEKFMSTNWMGQVHDSMILDTMPHEVKRVAFTGIKVFEDLPGIISDMWDVDFNLPMTGEAEWGKNYGELTSSVKHEDGKWILKQK